MSTNDPGKASQDGQPVLYETVDRVATITLNRPETANAQSTAMLDGLAEALACAGSDDGIHAVVIAGAGRHFSAGHDLKELERRYEGITVEGRYRYEEERFFNTAMAIRDIPKPVVAQVQGACIAGGLLLAGMCDLIVMADDAYLADPVVHFGTPGIEVQLHPWLFGDQLARDLLYTGRRLGAEEALARGVVARVVPAAELASEVAAMAARIAEAPRFSLRLTKRTLNRAQDVQGFRVAADAAFDTHQLSHACGAVPEGGDSIRRMKEQVGR